MTTSTLEAWNNNSWWKANLICELTRDVSKNGTILAFSHDLIELAACLPQSEIVWLYCQLQKSRRPDFEWRGEFLDIFKTISEADLPEPIISREEAERRSHEVREMSKFLFGEPPEIDDCEIPF
jgi:hypothetical protein